MPSIIQLVSLISMIIIGSHTTTNINNQSPVQCDVFCSFKFYKTHFSDKCDYRDILSNFTSINRITIARNIFKTCLMPCRTFNDEYDFVQLELCSQFRKVMKSGTECVCSYDDITPTTEALRYHETSVKQWMSSYQPTGFSFLGTNVLVLDRIIDRFIRDIIWIASRQTFYYDIVKLTPKPNYDDLLAITNEYNRVAPSDELRVREQGSMDLIVALTDEPASENVYIDENIACNIRCRSARYLNEHCHCEILV